MMLRVLALRPLSWGWTRYRDGWWVQTAVGPAFQPVNGRLGNLPHKSRRLLPAGLGMLGGNP